jgi:outer membrane protein assembly factor BamA
MGAFSFKKLGARGTYDGTFVREGSRDEYTVSALASGIEVNNFYGFGNNTSSDPGRDFFKADQNDFRLGLAYRPYLGGGVRGTLGAMGRFTTTSDRDPTLVTITQPYGFEDFAEVAGTAALELDLRDRPEAPTKGLWAQVTGNYFPAVLSVADSGSFGEVNGFVAGYLTPFDQVTLALRAGGKKVWGTFPFQESAFLGGLSTLRGYRDQRFAGDAAVYFNAGAEQHRLGRHLRRRARVV